MKLSELQLGQKATLVSKTIDYKFKGEVKKIGIRLWLTNNLKDGYIIDEKFDHLWDVKIADI